MFFKKKFTEPKCICDRYEKCNSIDSHLFKIEAEVFNLQRMIDGLYKKINDKIKKEPGFNKKIVFILIGSLTASLGAIYELFQIFCR